MKKKIEILVLAVALAIAGCGSDRNNSNETDSLMTDTTVIDTANMNIAPADSTVMREDSVSQNTGLVPN